MRINDKNRNILRWIFLVGVMVYLIASATPYEGVAGKGALRNVIFWSLNGALLLIVAINMIFSIYAAIKKADKKNAGNALCSIAIALILLLFVMDLYNHTVFYTIKQYLIAFVQ